MSLQEKGEDSPDKDSQKRMLCEVGGRDWTDGSTSQGHQGFQPPPRRDFREKHGTDHPLEPPRITKPADIWIWGLGTF